jgi:hypothetical protein
MKIRIAFIFLKPNSKVLYIHKSFDGASSHGERDAKDRACENLYDCPKDALPNLFSCAILCAIADLLVHL